MGAWSAEIMDDDGAEDIVGEYKILLGYGISSEEAYKKIEEYFYPDYRGGYDEDVYWLSIALYQWKNGILTDEVKRRAIECIDNEEYLERWKEDYRREQAYERKWQEEQEAKRKARKFYTCPWADGETFYIPLREEVEGGRMMMEQGYVGTVLVKVGIEDCIVTGTCGR